MSTQFDQQRATPVVSHACFILTHRDSYMEDLRSQGFSRTSIKNQVRVVTKLSDWLQSIDVPVERLTHHHCQTFLKTVLSKSDRKGYAGAVKRLVEHLVNLDLINVQADKQNQSPITEIVQAYTAHLRQVSGLSEKSISKYRPFVEQFLVTCFEESALQFSKLTAREVLDFFLNQAPLLSPSRNKSAATALRSFLRFLCFSGHTNVDLSGAVPTTPNWSLSEVPRAITPENIKKVLHCCPRQTAIGRRDYAILLLLSRLGLRASEIVSLTLDNIDWDNSSLDFSAKGGVATTLPIPADVGKALADYLTNARTHNNSRRLFLRSQAPLGGLGSQTTVATIVRTAIERAGIRTLQYGTHQFRHALAINLMNSKATLEEIGTILGHRHAKTTRIYAKVDYSSLRPLCLPWPGENR